MSLCYDSRAINDLDAQRFLDHLKLALDDPEIMITGTEGLHDLSALL